MVVVSFLFEPYRAIPQSLFVLAKPWTLRFFQLKRQALYIPFLRDSLIRETEKPWLRTWFMLHNAALCGIYPRDAVVKAARFGNYRKYKEKLPNLPRTQCMGCL